MKTKSKDYLKNYGYVIVIGISVYALFSEWPSPLSVRGAIETFFIGLACVWGVATQLLQDKVKELEYENSCLKEERKREQEIYEESLGYQNQTACMLPDQVSNEASQKKPPTQEEFWRIQREAPDFQLRFKQMMETMPRVVPYSYPIEQPLPPQEPPPAIGGYKPSLLRWLLMRNQ
jgi:hypothetical protein